MFCMRSLRQAALSLLILAILAGCNPLTSKVVDEIPAGSKTATTASAPSSHATPTQRPAAGTPTLAPTSAVQIDAEQLNGLDLLFWHPFSGVRQKQLAKMVETFNRQNQWGIEITLQAWNGWGELDEQARSISVLDKKPDILVGYNDQVLRWDASGYLFVDLDDYIEDAQWGLGLDERQAFYPAIWAQDFIPDGLVQGQQVPGGRRLGIPWYRSGLFFFYNATWGRELGFESPPDSPAELLLQSCTAAEANYKDADRANDGTGGWLVTPEPGLLPAWIFAFEGEIARPDREGYQFNTHEARQALEEMYEFYDSGCAWTGLEVDAHEAFAGRQALLVVDAVVSEVDFEDALNRFDNGDEWRLLPFFSPANEPVISVTGPSILVVKTSPERQLAGWLFARWLVSPDNQAAWAAATGFLPVSSKAVDLLNAAKPPSALRQALPFLPYSHPEPAYASWYTLRWSLAEALDQLSAPDLSAEKLAEILETLDKLAVEVHSQVR